MGQRIEGNAPLEPGRRISEAIGDDSVSQFVQRHGDQEGRNLQNEPLDEGGGIAAEEIAHQLLEETRLSGAGSSGADSSGSSGPGIR